MHSTHSDGKLTPEELVDLAIKQSLSTIAITDHEILSGNEVAKKYAENKNLNIISGIEIGADDEELNLYDVHIVGLFVDSKNKKLNELIEFCLEAREIQKKEIIVKLNLLGFEITFEELKMEAVGPSYGRPHIARILLRKYPNSFEGISDVFNKLLANRDTAYVRQRKKNIKEVIDTIHNAKGIAILAHPGFYKNKEDIIEKFIEFGGDGIELNYAYENNMEKTEANKVRLEVGDLVKGKKLILSGGTDFHDPRIHAMIGEFGISDEEFEVMKKYVESFRN